MIVIHEGVPGSGKSYDAVRKILDVLRAGRQVWANIDGFQSDTCREMIASLVGTTRAALDGLLYHLEPGQIARFWDYAPVGSFVCIDEAQLYFNSRDFAKAENRQFSDWASTHRHHGYDLLLITQRAERIDTAVRSLAEFRYRYRKLNFLGSAFKRGYLIYTHLGDDPKHMSFRKASYDVRVFACYQSYVGDASEKKFQRLPNLFNHPIFYGLAACVALTLYFASQSTLFTGNLAGVSNPLSVVEVQASHAEPGGPPAPAGDPVASSRPPAIPYVKKEGTTLPAIAGAVGPSPFLDIPVTGWLQAGDRLIVVAQGFRLPRVLALDRDNLVARVALSDLPPGFPTSSPSTAALPDRAGRQAVPASPAVPTI